MPVNPAPNGPSTSVLAYNGDSPRGWNDPPTFAFSNSSGSKPKLDLRKRVSHQQALHGTSTPPYSPNPPTTYGPTGAEVNDRMASLSLHSSPITTGNVVGLPPSVTPPQQPKIMHHHTPSVPLYTQPTTTHYDYHRSNSMPTIYMPTVSPAPVSHVEPISTPDIHNAISNPSSEPTTQAPVHLGQPLFSLKDHSFEPVKTHNDSGVRSMAEIGDHLDDHNHSPSNQPQIYHPTPQPVTNGVHSTASSAVGHITPPVMTTQPGRISPLPRGTRAVSPHPAIPVAPPSYPAMAMPVTSTLAHPTSVTNASILHPVGVSSSQAPLPVGHFSSPTPPVQSHMGGVTPNPPPVIPTLPVGARTPTPPSGLAPPTGSLSNGSTPQRCLSPEQADSGMSDEEGLKATVDALNDVIQKFKLEKRICDDIAKRLQVMSKMWMEGKLGKTVKTRMIKLAKALDDGDGEEAHHIHVSIIVDHVAEVNQWIVAVKRLISLVRHQKAASS